MEERFGFIHNELDIKILILYALRRLPAEIDGEKLGDLVLVDGGVGYFDYKQCLAELVESAQIEQNELGYKITAKGIRNCDILEGSLPYSVRVKCEKAAAPIVDKMRRDAMIIANHRSTDNGMMVHLAISDGVGSIFDLNILAADEGQAVAIERNFRKNAEGVYNRFIQELSE